MKASEVAKAIVGALGAGLAALLVAVQEGSAGGTGITAAEWISAAIAVVGVGTLVWGVPNSVPSITKTPPSV